MYNKSLDKYRFHLVCWEWRTVRDDYPPPAIHTRPRVGIHFPLCTIFLQNRITIEHEDSE
jgi:hypothetical protein